MLHAIAFIALTALPLVAQQNGGDEAPRGRFGIFGDVSLNYHTADFQKLPGVPNCCPRFETGDGLGFALGVLYEHPLARQLALLLRLGYIDYSGLLAAQEKEMLYVAPSYYEGTFEHTVDAALSAVAIEPMLAWRLVDRLSLLGGLQAGYVFGADYEQVETIVDPADRGVFVDTQLRTRNASAGSIPEASGFTASLVAGLRYEVPLDDDGTLTAAPEALFAYGLTPVVNDLDWQVNTLRFGVSLLYRPAEEKAPPPPPPPPPLPPPPPPPPPPALVADVTAVGVADDGSEHPIATIRVEEFISSEMRPLLHYVFFEEGNATLPDRYDRLVPTETAEFSYNQLKPRDVLTTYHHVLNIVGYRLREHPEATLRLVGTNSDEAVEKGDTGLSRRRAETVRDYLVRVWGIDQARLSVEERNLPEIPSNIAEVDGMQENRRVELLASIPEILDPIVIDDTLRTVNPPRVRFRPDVRSDAGITAWSLDVRQDHRTLTSFDGKLDVPRAIDWSVEEDRASIPRSDSDILYALSVTDAAAQHLRTTDGSLPVEQITVQRKRRERLGDKEIDRYNLILFDFNSEELGPRNIRIVGMIRPRISPTSTVTITGYTDRIGDVSVNQPLSEGRARSAALALGVLPEHARGLGETDMYTNDLPEGRFYCRTVTILVETPVE